MIIPPKVGPKSDPKYDPKWPILRMSDFVFFSTWQNDQTPLRNSSKTWMSLNAQNRPPLPPVRCNCPSIWGVFGRKRPKTALFRSFLGVLDLNQIGTPKLCFGPKLAVPQNGPSENQHQKGPKRPFFGCFFGVFGPFGDNRLYDNTCLSPSGE